jgi:hypothetical protein
MVFAVDGAGLAVRLSESLSDVFDEAGVRFRLCTIPWAEGGPHKDYLNVRGRTIAAACLAEKIKVRRATCPDAPIFLIGFGAGAHVVLAATECLPPNIVDRIILLAPAVCANYDLRPALRASRCGVISFHNTEDLALGFTADQHGISADGQRCTRIAGQRGFCLPARELPGAELYCKLRQVRWREEMDNIGHYGGHYGWLRPKFLHAAILPLFSGCHACP